MDFFIIIFIVVLSLYLLKLILLFVMYSSQKYFKLWQPQMDQETKTNVEESLEPQ